METPLRGSSNESRVFFRYVGRSPEHVSEGGYTQENDREQEIDWEECPLAPGDGRRSAAENKRKEHPRDDIGGECQQSETSQPLQPDGRLDAKHAPFQIGRKQ